MTKEGTMVVGGALIENQDIDDIMVSVLEGGINYWCDEATVVGDYLWEYASGQISRGGMLKLHAEEDDEWFVLTKAKFLSGLEAVLSDKSTKNAIVEVDEEGVRRVDPGNVDGPLADLIVQFALFGEIVYG